MAANYQIRVFGYNYETVREIADNLALRLRAFSRVGDINTNASSGSGGASSRSRVTELVVEPNRARLAVHGLTSRDLVSQVNAAVASAAVRADQMRIGGEEVRFAVKLAGHQSMDVLALQEVSVRGQTGSSVRLGEIATVRERDVLGQINRENQQYERTVAYEFNGPNRLGDVIQAAIIETTHLPPGYRVEGRPEYLLSSDDRRQIYSALALGILLVFMLSAALFESFRQPLCVLLTVPMALVGVFLVFFYTGASFTSEAYIGVIMMCGVVVNSAILLIDHINQLRAGGERSLTEAILDATVDRARPILMTTATTVLGLLPLVLFSDTADSRIWNALSYAMIGGLASSTIMVLTVTPALYLLFERRGERQRQKA
jgi:HAE1 family hydrophobic/amphiphilic exporter-1